MSDLDKEATKNLQSSADSAEMNEEKILDDINFCLEGEYITPEHYEAIQGLLNLYNKEKEKNKSLEQENSFLKMMYRGTDEFKAIENFAKEE